MENIPKVSVVIPTFNRAGLIHEAIKSVLNQSYRDFELIVIDNGSTDDTAIVVKSFPDNRIRYFYQQNSGSPVLPRNKGIKQASGKYIAFLDSDDLWLPDKLAAQVELLEKNPAVPLVFSDAYIINEQGATINRFSSLFRQFQGRVFKQLLRVNFIPNLTVMIRRDKALEYGCLDQRYKICHDLDLYLKVANEHEILRIDKPLAKLRLHQNNLTSARTLTRKELKEIISKWRSKEIESASDFYYRKILAFNCCMEGFDLLGAGQVNSAKKSFRQSARYISLNPLYGLLYLAAIIDHRLVLKVFKFLYEKRLNNGKISAIFRG
jgi:hypothetical protein